MHNAPTVSFPVGRSPLQGGVLVLLAGLGCLAVVIWCMGSDGLDWRHGTAAGACVAISASVVWSWWHTSIGSISWDGVAWHWAVGVRSVRVLPETVLDLQTALLLRLQMAEDRGVAWVWLDRASSPARWMALRRAIYCLARRAGAPLADIADNPLATRVP